MSVGFIDGSITTTQAQVALEVAPGSTGAVATETIGWFAAEQTLDGGGAQTCQCLEVDTAAGTIQTNFQSIVSGAVFEGWDGPGGRCDADDSVAYANMCFANSPVVGATKRTRNEAEAGWVRRCTNSSSTENRLVIDEERVPNRTHASESASIVAFWDRFHHSRHVEFFSGRAPDPWCAFPTDNGH